MGRLVYAQDVYAVTAACLMVRKDVYEQVNGLDESFAVAFNDVDFCVRVREAGYTNVFTPLPSCTTTRARAAGWTKALPSASALPLRWNASRSGGQSSWLRATPA